MGSSPIDREALERSIVIARRDPAYAKSIDSKLADGADWFDVAVGASFHCQMLNLHLSPWQSPPVYAHSRNLAGTKLPPSCSTGCSNAGSRNLSRTRSRL